MEFIMKRLELYEELFDHLNDGVYFVDINRKILYWNKGAENISGYSASEVVGSYCFNNFLSHTDDTGTRLCYEKCPLQECIWTKTINTASVYFQHKEGHRIPVYVKNVPISDDGKIIGAFQVFQERKEKLDSIYDIDELKALALMDSLTSLPNRRYMEAFIESRIAKYHSLGVTFGLLFMDVDHFKYFNDQYGHDIGDEVLRIISKTFSMNIRSSDLIGRWGGDEFVGVFLCQSIDQLRQIAEKIRALVESSSVSINDEQDKGITISIGAVLYQKDYTVSALMKHADACLYAAKSSGRNTVSIG